MPEHNDVVARYRVALEEYLHDEREFTPSCSLDGFPDANGIPIQDLARAHAEALSAAIKHVPPGALSAVLLRSAMALATAVMARRIWGPRSHELDSLSAHAAIEHYIEYARSVSMPFSVLLVDVDNLRAYNRAFGRKAGNEALSAIYSLLRSNCREGDAVTRCGGDEFCIILPGSSLRSGMIAAERARSTVEQHRFGQGRLTVSIGVVSWPADGSTVDQLMHLAYDACRMAFTLGGNAIYTPLTACAESDSLGCEQEAAASAGAAPCADQPA